MPRQRAIGNLVISEANAIPTSKELAAAHTAEKRRNHCSDRSSHTPKAVTARGTNLREGQATGRVELVRVLGDSAVERDQLHEPANRLNARR